MSKHEAKFGELLRHWLRRYPQETCSIETKQTRTDTFPLRDIKAAQLDWGHAISSDRGVLIRTQAVAEGMPDYIYMRGESAFVAIRFPSCFVLISIQRIQAEIDQRVKSITSRRAREICTVCEEL